MAAAPAREPTTPIPQPVIGKAGRYTVFITPPATPRPSPESPPSQTPITSSLRPSPLTSVQVPPPQFEKPATKGSRSVFGFFWDTLAKVQNAHSSLDEFLADWLGLDQSKYQWALNDYYESTESSKDCSKQQKELASKDQII